MTLYQRVLGPHFAQLPAVLQRFHGDAGGGKGAGLFRVTRPQGRLRNLVASLMHLPPAGEQVPVRLVVTPCGTGERWSRSFDEAPLETIQTEYRGLLVEKAGPVSLGFELETGPGGMTFRTRRVWLLGARVPLAWAPSVEATVTADEAGWLVQVAVRVPLLGRLVYYEGHLTPQ